MKAIRGNKILIVCQEGLSFPFYFLSSKWRQENKLAAFFYGPAECMYNKCVFNENTYYRFKHLEGVTVYDSKNIATDFSDLFNDTEILDCDYLEYIENNYTHFSSLNEQIMSSQLFSRHYHWRNYYSYVTQVQQINWLILNYKNIIKIIDEFKPDYIFDDAQAELARSVLIEVCWRRKIPYICNEYTRYKSYQIPSFTLAKREEKYFVDAYKKNLNSTKLKKYCDYVESFRNQNEIMTEENLRFFSHESSIVSSLKRLFGHLMYYYNEDIHAGNLKIKKKNPLLFPSSVELMRFFCRIEYWKNALLKQNKYFLMPDNSDEYVYMPLHLIPESTTFTKAPQYVNELSIIEAVSKSLPAHWKLYVKEHHAMLGERPISFYKAVNRIPNVMMVQLNYHKDPKQWIQRSKGVVTISGTSAFEAVMLNKPAIIFSSVSFDVIKGVFRVRSFEDLKGVFLEFCKPFDNLMECAVYIKTVEEFGVDFDLTYLYEQGEKIFRRKAFIDNEYRNQLSRMEKFYLKGIEISKTAELWEERL